MTGSDHVLFAPILHGKLTFALAVRDIFFAQRPDAIAVEFPETLHAPLERAVRRLPLLSLIRYREADGELAYVLIEPCDGVIEAVRLAIEHGIPWFAVDRDTEGYQGHLDPVPDAYAAERIGCESYVQHTAASLGAQTPSCDDDLREATMAFHLEHLGSKHRKVLFVCGIAHAQRIKRRLLGPTPRPLGRTRRLDVEVLHLHKESSQEVLSEPAWIQARFETWRSQFVDVPVPSSDADRYKLVRQLFFESRERMVREDGERVNSRSIRIALQFARNQALLRNALAPDLVELVAAARGVHSDDFAWHLWETATSYPYQDDAPDVPTYRVTLEELARRARHLVFHRRLKTRRHVLRLIKVRKRPEREGQWDAAHPGLYTCSYPPEDIQIESVSAFLRKRAQGIIASNRARVVPFTASLCDGIDIRETIRNRLRDGRLYVREDMPIHGEIHALVLIFDDKDGDGRYKFTMTWQGEHEQESDMALYATPPEAHPVGPGIGRCEYGGFLMTYPPGRLFHVFEDPFFDDAENFAERLLLAAVDYGLGRWVLYIGPRPPRARTVMNARRAGKQVLYIPIGQISPQTLRRLRVFHVLEGKEVRSYAKDYV